MKKIALGLSLITASLFASEYQIGLGLGQHNVSNSPIEDYKFLNLRVGKTLPKNHILRIEIEQGEKVINNQDHITRILLNVEHYFPQKDSKITPYAFVGLGAQSLQGDAQYPNNMVADLGVGAKYNIKNTWDLFAEARGLRDFGNNDNHYGFIAGVLFGFDAEKAEKKVIDSDKDGVADKNDKCLNTPAGAKVDINGCAIDSDNDGVADYQDKCANTPAGVKVDANGCAIDSDNDGVADYQDKCANTPAGVKVDANGCAIDSDNDGVADYQDKCANTPSGFKVDTTGCPLSYRLHITFANNSVVISASEMPKVEKFAEFLKANPAYKVEIQGYTDSKGSEKYNLSLSQKRAKAVYVALIDLGVDANRLSYKGYGESNPIASNDTAEGRAQNRRIVAKLSH